MAIKELKARISADATRLLQACSKSTAAIKDLASTTVGKMAASRRAHRENVAEIERHKTAIDKLKKANGELKGAGGAKAGADGAGGAKAGADGAGTSFGTIFKGVFTAQAALKAITGSFNLFKNKTVELINGLDRIGKSAANLGVSTSYFQKLSFAAQRTGTSFEIVYQGFGKIKKFAADAANGNKIAQDAFHALGISISELGDLSAEQLFDRVNAAIVSLEDPLERDRIAAQLFGEQFTKVNNFLREYVDLGNEAEAKGLIVDEESVKAAEQLLDALTNLNTSLMALAANSGLTKWLNEVAEGVMAVKNSAQTEAFMAERKIKPEIEDKTKGAVKPFKFLFNSFGKQIDMMQGILGRGWAWDKDFKPLMGPTWTDIIAEKRTGKSVDGFYTDAVTDRDIAARRAELGESETYKKQQAEQKRQAKERVEQEKYDSGLAGIQLDIQKRRDRAAAKATGETSSDPVADILATTEGLDRARALGKEQYSKANAGKLLPETKASDLEYIRLGIALMDQEQAAKEKRLAAEERLADAMAAVGIGAFDRQRQLLDREIRAYEQAGAAKEQIARYQAARLEQIAKDEAAHRANIDDAAAERQANLQRQAAQRAAIEAERAARASADATVRHIEGANRQLRAELEKFAFDPAAVNPDETNRERRSRVKTQRLDESIAEKQTRQREGKRVHFTKRERDRIAEAQGIAGQIAANDRQAAAIRNKEIVPVAPPAPAPAPIRQNPPAPRRAPQPAPAPAVPAPPAPILPIPPEPPRPYPPPQVAPVAPQTPPQVAPVAPAAVSTLIAPGLTPAVNTVADQQLTALIAIQNAISAMAKNYYTVRGA